MRSAVRDTMFPLIPLSSEKDDWTNHYIRKHEDRALNIGVYSLQGKRPYQEDEYSIHEFLGSTHATASDPKCQGPLTTHFFGLFDGHAGGRCSKYISSNLPEVLAQDGLFTSNLPMALKRSFHTTNDSFLKIADQQRLHDGSTGICSIIRNGKLLVGNVGDCRSLLLSAGKPIQMSIDQKPTNPEEVKRIISLGGTITNNLGVARVNGVLAVSRAFGNRKLRKVIRPDIEMVQRDLTPEDDYLIMASDGLWDVLRNKDVCDISYSLAASHFPQQIAEELVDSAIARGSMDNVTCIVVKLSDYTGNLDTDNNYETQIFGDSFADRASARPQSKYQGRAHYPERPTSLHPSQTHIQGPLSQRVPIPGVDSSSPDYSRYVNGYSVGDQSHWQSKCATGSSSSKLEAVNSCMNVSSNSDQFASTDLPEGTSEGDRGECIGARGVRGTTECDLSHGAVRPWTGSPPSALQTYSGTSQDRQQSPTTPSKPFDRSQNQQALSRISTKATYSQSQQHQTSRENYFSPPFHRHPCAGSERAESDTDESTYVTGRSTNSTTPYFINRFSNNLPPAAFNRSQHSPPGTFLSGGSMHKDHRGGHATHREPVWCKAPGSPNVLFPSNLRASSASAASVRHAHNISGAPKLFSKVASADFFSLQQPQRSTSNLPFYPRENALSSTSGASRSLPTCLGSGALPASGAQSVYSTSAFSAPANDQQWGATRRQKFPPSRHLSASNNASSSSIERNRGPLIPNREVSHIRFSNS